MRSTCSAGRNSWMSTAPCPRSSSRRSEEHTSELQSLTNLVCRLLLEKKKTGSSERPGRGPWDLIDDRHEARPARRERLATVRRAAPDIRHLGAGLRRPV